MSLDLYKLVRPLIHAMDAEDAHRLAIRALKAGLTPCDRSKPDPRLAQTIWDLNFPNPVGLAAGFDKNAEALDGLFTAGFGFVEAGTVTPLSQEGNPRPRVFRDAGSQSVINRMGFPGLGADMFFKNFRTRKKNGIVGINIGKNKLTEDPAADYLELVTRFAPMADYMTINISSPNTPGLRDLQAREFLQPFIADIKNKCAIACAGKRQPPLLIKLAPDLTQSQAIDLAQTLQAAHIDGIIMGNTTLDRPESLPETFRKQTGGLSGPHARAKSTALIRHFYQLTGGRIPIIGVGGISSAEDAYAKIRAGACLVQLYTALVYEGPGLIKRIKSDLAALLARDGFANVKNAIGIDAR